MQVYSREYLDSAQIVPGLRVNWREITGVLHPKIVLPNADYTKKDSDNSYCNSAWQSWWLAVQRQINCMVNRASHTMLSPEYWSLAHIYHQAIIAGIKTPTWSYSSKKNNTMCGVSYYSISQFIGAGDFRLSTQVNDFNIAYVVGRPVICLVVGEKVFAKALANGGCIELPTTLKVNLIKLRCNMNLVIMQVFFKISAEEQWVLHHLTPDMEWQYWENNEKIPEAIWKLFKPRPTKVKTCAIPKSQRPNLINFSDN